jgi:hypothetical protein
MFFTEIRQRVFAVSIQIFVVALITAALALQFAQPKPDFVWCAWNDVAESFRTEDGPDQVVVFEDLVAYHIWFALRKTPGKRIFVVNDAPGVHEDKAYFLPRGFGEVGRITLDQVPRDGFSIRQSLRFRRSFSRASFRENSPYSIAAVNKRSSSR